MKSYDKPEFYITRKNPRTGFRETIKFLGTIKEIPKGWRIASINNN